MLAASLTSLSLAAAQHLNYTIFIIISLYFKPKEERKSFAVGHFAFGYILSRLTAQATKTKLDIPLILALSVLPDIDILLPFLEHRGPTHSIITTTIIFIPIFVVWHRNALPYFVALIQHSLVGDIIAGGKTQLLWPLTLQTYGLEISINSMANVSLEWAAFLASVVILSKTGEIKTLLTPRNSNLILFIPITTVLLPTIVAYPLNVPLALAPPHILFLALFSVSILIDIKQFFPWLLRRQKRYCRKN